MTNAIRPANAHELTKDNGDTALVTVKNGIQYLSVTV